MLFGSSAPRSNVPSVLTFAERTMSPDGSCNTTSTVVNPLGSRTPFGMSSTRETPPTTGGGCCPPQAPSRTITASHLISVATLSDSHHVAQPVDSQADVGRGRDHYGNRS